MNILDEFLRALAAQERRLATRFIRQARELTLGDLCAMLEEGLHERCGVDDRAVMRVDASITKVSLRSARRRQQPTGRRRESVAAQLSRPVFTSGGGATQVQALQEGLLRLFEMGMDDQLLWARELKMLIATKVGISLHCCTKTVNRALRKLAAHTSLIVPVGRKWRLQFGTLRDTEAATVGQPPPSLASSTPQGARA